MLSSTSSSDRYLPKLPWLRIMAIVVLVFFAFVFWMEFRLAQLGYRPEVSDSRERWKKERARAGQLGRNALILLGASRIQLGVDLDVLRQETGLEPVQLALDGSLADPILTGLAADPDVRGTVLVDYYNFVLNDDKLAERFERDYERNPYQGASLSPGVKIETMLVELRQKYLLSYSGGASPLNSLRTRIAPNLVARHFHTIFPDRSGMADYSLRKMPDFYFGTVAGYLGLPMRNDFTESFLKRKIERVHPQDNHELRERAKAIKENIEKIEARGGHVLFIGMPLSGMVRDIEERKYPRSMFWDVFVAQVGVSAINSAYTPLLRDFHCPDGSHLDYKDRTKFTFAMINALHLSRESRQN